MKNSTELMLCLSDGHFGLGGYIALSPKRQEDLLGLADMIRAYIKNGNSKRPLNILLEARPGAGKSYLVKELSRLVDRTLEKRGVQFLTFNLTTMESPRDLAPCFRKIQNCNLAGGFPVVLFDEVDTRFPPDRFCYSSFLAPMYDGKVYDGGEFFYTGQAVFFFAASKALLDPRTYKKIKNKERSPTHESGEIDQEPKEPAQALEDSEKLQTKGSDEATPDSGTDITYPVWLQKRMNEMKEVLEHLSYNFSDAPDKLLDFLDRLDRIVFLPQPGVKPEIKTKSGKEEEMKTQKKSSSDEKKAQSELYLIVLSMIFQRFPKGIKYVENQVFAILSNSLLSGASRRKPDSFVAHSYPPIDGVFRVENLPPHCRDELREIFERIELYDGYCEKPTTRVARNRHDNK